MCVNVDVKLSCVWRWGFSGVSLTLKKQQKVELLSEYFPMPILASRVIGTVLGDQECSKWKYSVFIPQNSGQSVLQTQALVCTLKQQWQEVKSNTVGSDIVHGWDCHLEKPFSLQFSVKMLCFQRENSRKKEFVSEAQHL